MKLGQFTYYNTTDEINDRLSDLGVDVRYDKSKDMYNIDAPCHESKSGVHRSFWYKDCACGRGIELGCWSCLDRPYERRSFEVLLGKKSTVIQCGCSYADKPANSSKVMLTKRGKHYSLGQLYEEEVWMLGMLVGKVKMPASMYINGQKYRWTQSTSDLNLAKKGGIDDKGVRILPWMTVDRICDALPYVKANGIHYGMSLGGTKEDPCVHDVYVIDLDVREDTKGTRLFVNRTKKRLDELHIPWYSSMGGLGLHAYSRMPDPHKWKAQQKFESTDKSICIEVFAPGSRRYIATRFETVSIDIEASIPMLRYEDFVKLFSK